MPVTPVGTPNPSVDERGLAQRIASALRATTVRLGYLMLDRLDVSGDISCQNLNVRNKGQWVAPTMLNNWVYYGTPEAPPGYRKDALGYVHLRGVIKNGTFQVAAFQLPTGYRPAYTLVFNCIANNAIAHTEVDITGNVNVVVNNIGSNTWYSLDGITFLAEQ